MARELGILSRFGLRHGVTKTYFETMTARQPVKKHTQLIACGRCSSNSILIISKLIMQNSNLGIRCELRCNLGCDTFSKLSFYDKRNWSFIEIYKIFKPLHLIHFGPVIPHYYDSISATLRCQSIRRHNIDQTLKFEILTITVDIFCSFACILTYFS